MRTLPFLRVSGRSAAPVCDSCVLVYIQQEGGAKARTNLYTGQSINSYTRLLRRAQIVSLQRRERRARELLRHISRYTQTGPSFSTVSIYLSISYELSFLCFEGKTSSSERGGEERRSAVGAGGGVVETSATASLLIPRRSSSSFSNSKWVGGIGQWRSAVMSFGEKAKDVFQQNASGVFDHVAATAQSNKHGEARQPRSCTCVKECCGRESERRVRSSSRRYVDIFLYFCLSACS